MDRKSLRLEIDLLQGNINRMLISDDIKEIKSQYEWALTRLDTIYQMILEEKGDTIES